MICVLSCEEVGRLKHYGHEPDHNAHRHITIKQTVRLLKLGKMELVDHEGSQYVTPSRLYVLKSRKSDGVIRTIQRVIGTPMKHITPPPMLDLSKE